MNDDELSELIARRAALLEQRAQINTRLAELSQEIIAAMQQRGIDRCEGAALTRRRRFRPFVAQDLIDREGLSDRERAALIKEVVDVAALKELRPDIYDASCEPGEAHLVQRVRDGGEDL